MNMKKGSIESSIILVLAVAAVFAGVYWWHGSKKCCDHSVEVAKESNVILVNVLDKEYFDDCHIKGSINVPFAQLEEASLSWNKESTIVVYCANYACTTSAVAAKKLIDLGFKNVAAYEAGMAEWFQFKLAFEGQATNEYLSAKNDKIATEHEVNIPVIDTADLQKLLAHDSSLQTCDTKNLKEIENSDINKEVSVLNHLEANNEKHDHEDCLNLDHHSNNSGLVVEQK